MSNCDKSGCENSAKASCWIDGKEKRVCYSCGFNAQTLNYIMARKEMDTLKSALALQHEANRKAEQRGHQLESDLAKCREENDKLIELGCDFVKKAESDQECIHQLEAERDKFKGLMVMVNKSCDRRGKRITTLEARLRKYGRHESLCDISLATGTKCSCGLTDPIEGK